MTQRFSPDSVASGRLASVRRLLLLVFAGLALLGLFYEVLQIPYGDEALDILQSKLMVQGQVPYRDFFEFTFPGDLYFGAALIRLLGPSVIALRLSVFLLLAAAALALYRLGGRLGSRSSSLQTSASVSFSPGFLLSWLSPWFAFFFAVYLMDTVLLNPFFAHHGACAGMAVLALYSAIGYLETGRKSRLIASSVLTGCSLFSMQSVGVLLAASLIASLAFVLKVIRKEAALNVIRLLALYYVLPLGLLISGMFAFLAMQGCLSEFIRDAFGWLGQGTYHKTSIFGYFSNGLLEIVKTGFKVEPVRRLIPQWPLIPNAFQIFITGWLPVLGILWAGDTLIRHRRRLVGYSPAETSSAGYSSLVVLFSVSVALLVSTLSYSTPYKVSVYGMPAVLLGFLALQSLFGRPLLKKYAALSAWVFCGFLLYLFCFRVWVLNDISANPKHWVASYGTTEGKFYSMQGLQASLSDATLTELIRQNTQPGETVFILNASPHLNLLSDRAPVGRFSIVYPVYTTEAQLAEILRDLRSHPPRIIVDDGKEALMLKYDLRFSAVKNPSPGLEAIRAFMKKHYTAVWEFNRATAWLWNGSTS